MLITKRFEGSVFSNYRSVSNNASGQTITETSTLTIDGLTDRFSTFSQNPLLSVDGLLPVGTKFRLTLEEVEA